MNLSRFIYLTWKYSPNRAYEYEQLNALAIQLPPKRAILDLGGGKKSHYAPLFANHTLDSVNLSKDMHPTYTADLMQPLPIPDNTYDLVISMNTFEHIPSLFPALPESKRVLKSDGKLFFTIPFLHHTHGLPHDYARYTSSALQLALETAGYTKTHITPLGHGALTACSSNIHGLIPRFLKPLRPIMCGIAYALDSVLFFLSKKYRAHFGPTIFPLGYAVTVTKP